MCDMNPSDSGYQWLEFSRLLAESTNDIYEKVFHMKIIFNINVDPDGSLIANIRRAFGVPEFIKGYEFAQG